MRRALVMVAALIACGDSSSGAGSASASASAVRSGPRIDTTPAPITSAEPTQPKIRENAARGPVVDGVALEVRAFVSRLTTKDPVHIAIQTVPEKPSESGSPASRELIDMDILLSNLEIEVKTPAGETTTFKGKASKGQGTRLLYSGPFSLTLAEEAKADDAWTLPAPGLLAKPGKYTVGARSKISTPGRTLVLATSPIDIQVVEPNADVKPLAELQSLAADIVKNRKALEQAPLYLGRPVEDADFNVSFRFQISPPWGGKDVEVIEVLLDRKGKLLFYDPFRHSTCIAQGTPVDTPDGPIPIERLHIGSQVLAFDLERERITVTTVQAIDRAYAEHLVLLGELRATPNHPVFADGRWQDAAAIASGAALLGGDLGVHFAQPTTAVHPSTVIDLSVGPPHNYFAGGVLVHNKAAYQTVGGNGQPWGGLFYRRAAKR